MPKVKSTPVSAADSKSFFAGSSPVGNPEPPMLAKSDVEELPAPAGAVQSVTGNVQPGENITAPPAPSPNLPPATTPPPAVVPAPAPTAVAEPFLLLWSRTTSDEPTPDNRGIAKYGDKRSLRAAEIKGVGCLVKSSWAMNNGVIAEAMCFVPGVTIQKNGDNFELVSVEFAAKSPNKYYHGNPA